MLEFGSFLRKMTDFRYKRSVNGPELCGLVRSSKPTNQASFHRLKRDTNVFIVQPIS